MLEGPLVFVDIDTQRDFLEPTGALYVPRFRRDLPNLRRLTQFAAHHRIPVFATACAHHPDDPELTIFPPHCMAGYDGTAARGRDGLADSVVLDVDERLAGELPPPSHASQVRAGRFQPAGCRRADRTLRSRQPDLRRLWRGDRLLRRARPWRDC